MTTASYKVTRCEKTVATAGTPYKAMLAARDYARSIGFQLWFAPGVRQYAETHGRVAMCARGQDQQELWLVVSPVVEASS